MVKKKNLNERMFLDHKKASELKLKIKQLADSCEYRVPDHMEELLLNEIRLSTDSANEHLRERARLLGLI